MENKCIVCKETIDTLGSLFTTFGIKYCYTCRKKVWDMRDGHQYYKKLFVDCPFCKTKINITKNYPKKCPKCKVIMCSPSYCGFCESKFTFMQKRIK